MLKKLLFILPLTFALAAGIGCSDDDDDPTGPGDVGFVEGTIEAGGAYVTSINASDSDEFVGFAFADREITSDVEVEGGAGWDIAFRREDIAMNPAAPSLRGARLAGAEFAEVDAADVPAENSQAWQGGGVAYAIDDWYSYANQQIAMTRNVYSLLDASGQHWVKFRVDAVVGATGQNNMGTVEISYFYQSTAGSLVLDGEIQTASIVVADGTGYFDFSAGQQVTPSTPGTSLDWDIAFSHFTLALNGGASGSGAATAFFAHTELDDPTDLAAFAAQPEFAQTFPDTYGSALSEWYDYNGATHELSPKDAVYLVRTADAVYKVELESYYGDVGGQPASAHYRFRWDEIE